MGVLVCILGLAAFMIAQSGGWGAGGENGGETAAPGFLGTGPGGPGQQPGGKPSGVLPSGSTPSGGAGEPGGNGPAPGGSGGGTSVPVSHPAVSGGGSGVPQGPSAGAQPKISIHNPLPPQMGFEVEVEKDNLYADVRAVFEDIPLENDGKSCKDIDEKIANIVRVTGLGALSMKAGDAPNRNEQKLLRYFVDSTAGAILQNNEQMAALAAIWEQAFLQKVAILSAIKNLHIANHKEQSNPAAVSGVRVKMEVDNIPFSGAASESSGRAEGQDPTREAAAEVQVQELPQRIDSALPEKQDAEFLDNNTQFPGAASGSSRRAEGQEPAKDSLKETAAELQELLQRSDSLDGKPKDIFVKAVVQFCQQKNIDSLEDLNAGRIFSSLCLLLGVFFVMECECVDGRTTFCCPVVEQRETRAGLE